MCIWNFPSPYGVSFILIFIAYDKNSIIFYLYFPSPYGVSFILMVATFGGIDEGIQEYFRLLTEYHSFLLYTRKINNSCNSRNISVSLRSIIHSYLIWNFILSPPFPLRISVSLRSIIHSYFNACKLEYSSCFISVSLRSIIHSYLRMVRMFDSTILNFRLLTEYHSFLWKIGK